MHLKSARKKTFFFVILLMSTIYLSVLDDSYANDMDDGITTDEISSENILKKNPNIAYIKRYAETQVHLKRGQAHKKSNSCDQGSATVEPGAKVKNIYVITKGTRNTVYCSK
jgi:hypothetical protein